jgi:hypothetical protein
MDEVNKNPGDQYIPVSISLQPFDVEMLDRFKDMRRVTRSQLIREALQLYYLKIIGSPPPETGIYVDAAGNKVSFGLLTDDGKAKVASGEWRLLKEFEG